MKRKKLLSVLVAAALGCSLFAAVPVVSQAATATYTSGDWTYAFKYCYDYHNNRTVDNGCSIAHYNGSDNNVVIPSELDGYTVKVIGGDPRTVGCLFNDNNQITSVIIPSSVQVIGRCAFGYNCRSLEKITIPDSVQDIAEEAFLYCTSFKEISIPNSVKVIGNFAFSSCSSLEKITIPNSVQNIGQNAFVGCTSLKEIVIPDSVQRIRGATFARCTSLKEIRLPDSVKTVEGYAFAGCSSLEDFYDYNYNTKYLDEAYSDKSGDTIHDLPVFDETTSVTMHGYLGSNAETYAKKHNIPFVPLTDKLMYRLYNPYSGEHFYTSNASEKNNLVSVGWTPEGTAWTAPNSSNSPVYRLYNPNSGEHHYTMDAGEKDNLVGLGWKDEGIGWYSDDNQGTPLYRLYNPNATGQYEAGGHHYTKDVNEKNSLIAAGWRDEGIGWYGI